MQLQRDVGVFGRVLGRALDLDLIEADLRCALAAHFLESNRLALQVAQRQAIHVMALVRFEYIRFEQGVVHDAAQRDAVVGEDVAVVFQVLADFRLARVFQPRLQFIQYEFARQLRRRVLVTMRDRNVGGDARLAAQ